VIWEASNAIGVNGDETDNSEVGSGAAYVFVRTGTTWTQQAYLKASNTESDDQFGHSVAVSGDTVVIGAPYEDSNATGVNGNQSDESATWAGAAYVFVRSGTNWTQQAYLKASNTGADDVFGNSVAVSGDTFVAGAYREDSSATGMNGDQSDNGASNSGATYVFTWVPSELAPIATINHTAGGVHLTIPVSAGQSIGVQYSEFLLPISWVDIGDFIVTGAAGDFTDSDPARMARASGYYRAVLR
jgi:FG-GAP repeat